MSVRLGWFLGWKAFRSRGGDGKFLVSSSLALALGLVPLVVVLSIADGMIAGISSRTIETYLYHDQAWPLTSDGGDLVGKLQGVPGFRSAFAEQQGFALAYSSAGRLGVNLRGVDPAWSRDPGVAQFLRAVSGTLDFPNRQTAWIGRETAQKLGLKTGDSLKLLTTRSAGALSVPRVTTLTVAAVVTVGYQELDRLWVFVPLEESLTLLDRAENPIFWGIKSNRPLDQTQAFLRDVRQALGPDWQAYSWQTTGRSQFLNYQATRVMLLVVMALILLVASVNISTSMVTLVQQRRQETALLKALGASASLVRGQFLVLGLCAGVLGTGVGMGVGLLTAVSVNQLISGLEAVLTAFSVVRSWWSAAPVAPVHLIDPTYYLDNLPVQFDGGLLALVALGSVALAVVASAIPAWKASRQRPLEVLRRV